MKLSRLGLRLHVHNNLTCFYVTPFLWLQKAEVALEKDEKLIEKEGKTKILAAIEAIANGAPASAPVAAILTGAEVSALRSSRKLRVADMLIPS